MKQYINVIIWYYGKCGPKANELQQSIKFGPWLNSATLFIAWSSEALLLSRVSSGSYWQSVLSF